MNPNSPSSTSSRDNSDSRRDPQSPAPSQPADAWLEAALRETAREHIDDAGFTARLREQLPAPKVRRVIGRRQIVLGIFVGLATATALPFWLRSDLTHAGQQLSAKMRPLAELVSFNDASLLIAGCVIAGGCLVFAARQWAKARG